MRQLTIMPDEAAARRLAAFLITQKIEAHAEQEKEGWAIWVREEDRLAAAKEHLSKFRLEPDHARYRSAEQQAQALVREEQEKRERAQRNVHDVSRQWGRGGIAAPKSCPLVIAMILASVFVALLTSVGDSNPQLIGQLQFNGARSHAVVNEAGEEMIEPSPVWTNVRAGEIWRLVTPIFLHFGFMHLIFNMMWLYDFGGQIEHQLKTVRFLAIVIAVAVLSCIAEVVFGLVFAVRPDFPWVGNFGGMSGVNYALFGFLYIRTQMFQDRYILHPSTIVLMFIWLFACMVWNQLPRSIVGENAAHVANAAHVGGLLAGMALAYLPVFKK